MVQKKTWEEFRKTGLLLFVNSFLHIFGWAIVVEVERGTTDVTNIYPARVKFRGFDENSQSEAHVALTEYMEENIKELVEESKLKD